MNKEERYKATLTELRTQLIQNQRHLSDITLEKGVLNWLKAYPISDQQTTMISTNNNFGTVFVYLMAGD